MNNTKSERKIDTDLVRYDYELFSRLAWRFYLASFISVAFLAFAWYQADRYIEIEKWKKEEASSVYWPSVELAGQFREVGNDLMSIVSKQRTFFGSDIAIHRLADEFIRIARNRQSYYRIAFVAPDGSELVRVDVDDGIAEVIPPEGLAYRGVAPFFRKAMNLGKNELFMSRFDMSDDGDDALVLRLPAMRVAMPVFDGENEKRGVLVINSLGEKIIEHMEIHDEISDNQLFLVNNKGRLLYSSAATAGADAGRDGFNHIYSLWRLVRNGKEGQFMHDGALVTFRQVDVPEHRWRAGAKSDPSLVNFRLYTDEKPWRIVSVVEPEVLAAGANRRAGVVLGFFSLLLLLMIPISRSWAHSRVNGAADGDRVKTFAHIVEQSDELVYVTDTGGNVCYANQALLTELERIEASGIQILHGCKTIVGMSVCKVWGAFPDTLSDIKRALSQDEFFVVRYINDRGFRIHYSPLRYATGAFGGVVCVATDISERLLVEKQLEKSEKRLSDLASHLESVREEERASIARDLHDELGSTLTGVKFDVGLTEKRLRSLLGEEDSACFDLIKNGLDAAINRVRQVTTRLHPQMLSDLGLYAALEWQVDEFRGRSGLVVDFEVRCDGEVVSRMSYSRAVAVYRIVQECLTNILRHAHADSVVVELDACEQDRFVLVVADDGVGASSEQLFETQTFGVLGMQERARHLGGRLDVESGIGIGTRISLTVPLDNEEVNGSSDR